MGEESDNLNILPQKSIFKKNIMNQDQEINIQKNVKKTNIRSPKFKNIIGMSGKIKIFDQDLSNKYDTKARDIIKKIMPESVIDNPNIYGEDMIVINKKIPFDFIELQVYGKWKDEKFPYELPFIYERKMKFSAKTLFICFNSSYTKLIMFSRANVCSIKYRIKKYSREYIHYVPWFRTMQENTNLFSAKTILNFSGIYENDDEKIEL